MIRRPARTFEDLLVWQKAHALALGVYKLTAEFPPQERYHLTAQLRDAAVSISANIAEGFRRRTRPDKLRFLSIAHGSLDETRCILRLSEDLRYAATAHLKPLAEEVSKMLEGYTRRIREDDQNTAHRRQNTE